MVTDWIIKKYNYFKDVGRYTITFAYIDRKIFFLLILGIICQVISNFIHSPALFYASYIFLIFGMAVGYKKYPIYAIIFLLALISLTIAYVVTTNQFSPTENIQIIGAGITSLIFVVTFWYSSIMLRQIKIMNNEKLGKVISEISRSIFSPLRNELNDFRTRLKVRSYVWEIYPPSLRFGMKGINIVNHYLKEEVEIYPISNSSDGKKPITRSAQRLLKIEDEDLIFASIRLNEENENFLKNYDNLNNLYKQFESDFRPYWIPFKEECKKLIIESHEKKEYITTDLVENDFLNILKSAFTQQNFRSRVPGVLEGVQAELPRFTSENKEILLQWLKNIPILRTDLKNIEMQELKLLRVIEEMISLINYLLSSWKVTYYLTEEELQILESEYMV